MRYFTLARYTDEGILDTSFGGGDGFVLTAFPSATAQSANSIAIDLDKKIVAGGYVPGPDTGGDPIALARYLPDGTLDEDFGAGDGLVTTDFLFASPQGAASIAIDSEGRIVAGGGAIVDDFARFGLARFLPDGTLDEDFGEGGLATTYFSSKREEGGGVDSIAIDSEGRIVAGGSATVDGQPQFALARYLSDGTLDTNFSENGKVLTDFPPATRQWGNSIAIDSEGRIVAGGGATVDGQPQFALARYLSDGTLDTNFGENGKILTDFYEGEILSIAIDSAARIVAGGWAIVDGSSKFGIARYIDEGILDASFGKDNNGIVLTDFPSATGQGANSIAIDSEGRIVAGGWASVGSPPQFALARYTDEGILDESFGDGGKVLTKFALKQPLIHLLSEYVYEQHINSIAIDSEGNIVVGGWADVRRLLSPQLIAAMLAALVAIGFLGFYLGWWGEGCPPYCLPIPDWFIHNR